MAGAACWAATGSVEGSAQKDSREATAEADEPWKRSRDHGVSRLYGNHVWPWSRNRTARWHGCAPFRRWGDRKGGHALKHPTNHAFTPYDRSLVESNRGAPPTTSLGPAHDHGGARSQHRRGRIHPRDCGRVPDHGKLAPWRFILFEGEGRSRAGDVIASVFALDHPEAPEKRIEVERTRLLHAPLIIGVVSRAAPHVKIPEWEQMLSAGAATMNLIVAANALGFVTAWLTEWFSYDEARRREARPRRRGALRRLRSHRPAHRADRGSRASDRGGSDHDLLNLRA